MITDAYGAAFISEKGWFGDISDIAPDTEYDENTGGGSVC